MAKPPRLPTKSSRTSSAPSLFETARHLILPKGIVSSGWPAVEKTCRVGFKITFDPWQEGAGKAILGKNKDSLYCADAIVISIARQVGKTFLIAAIIFALSIITPGTLTLWTAHRGATAKDTFKDLKSFAQRREVAPHIDQIFDSANDMRIVFKNGSTIHFGARERGFGRGFKRVAIIVFDEAQILTANAVDDMVPAANRHPNPLIIYIGTPPKPSDPSEHFSTLRHDAISGDSTTTLYIEISADQCKDPKLRGKHVRDREQWSKGNPSHPVHTPVRAMLRMLSNLGVDSFMREGLGVWDEDATSKPFAPGAWSALKTRKRKKPEVGALGIAADKDQVWLALTAVSREDRPAIWPVVKMRADRELHDFVKKVAKIQRQTGCSVGIDEKGPASFAIRKLEDEGVVLSPATTEDSIQASADVKGFVARGEVQHFDDDELNEAIDTAGWRNVGDRRLFARGDGDVSLLEAAALALWALENGDQMSVHGFASLDLCDRCEKQPHEDPDGEHAYLCIDCREEA